MTIARCASQLFGALLSVAIGGATCDATAGESAWQLDRAVLVMRHGVRPPTKSARELAPLADRPWPDEAAWGAAPGDLTPRGAAAIASLASGVRELYAQEGLFALSGPAPDEVFIWGDGQDERTRETARVMAENIAPGKAVSFETAGRGPDPLFNGLDSPGCTLQATEVQAALAQRPTIDAAVLKPGLDRLQAIVAPDACRGGAGTCLMGPTTVASSSKGVKLTGGLEIAASVAEDLLLEYENGMSGENFGWARARADDLALVLPVHNATARFTRELPPVAARRGGPLARVVFAALNGDSTKSLPALGTRDKLVIFVGHDTTLSSLASIFSLDWSLPGQPDRTAPGTVLAFERWTERATSRHLVRVRIIYQDLEQMHASPSASIHQLPLPIGACSGEDGGSCSLTSLGDALQKSLPKDCL